MTRRLATLVASGAVLATLSWSAPAAASTPGAGRRPVGGESETVEVKVRDNSFRPRKLAILPGTTVRWSNAGRNEHDVVPNKGSRFGVDELTPDQSYSYRFDKPGRYAYYCSFHGAPGAGQHASITVVEPEEA